MLFIVKKIGSGASGNVLQGTYKGIDVAVKVSAPPEITSESLESFHHEAIIMTKLQHPHIVKFYGIIIRPPEVGMVFELCEGGSLKENIDNFGSTWSMSDRIRAFYQAAQAVAYLHRTGLIHRDIKPDNFFIGKNKSVKLGDFGECIPIVREVDATEKMDICGTVAYMAPELVRGDKWYSEKVDIYALGISFWEIISSSIAFNDLPVFKIYDRVGRGARPVMDPAFFPEELAAIMNQVWAQNAEDRPSGDQLVTLLENYMKAHDMIILDQNVITNKKEYFNKDESVYSTNFWLSRLSGIVNGIMGRDILPSQKSNPANEHVVKSKPGNLVKQRSSFLHVAEIEKQFYTNNASGIGLEMESVQSPMTNDQSFSV
jgi:serine/threonine protein kinase